MVLFDQESVGQAQAMVLRRRRTAPHTSARCAGPAAFCAYPAAGFWCQTRAPHSGSRLSPRRRAFAQSSARCVRRSAGRGKGRPVQTAADWRGIAIFHVPCYLYIIARQLDKDLFNPAFTAKNTVFAGDNDRVGACASCGNNCAVMSLSASTSPPKSSCKARAPRLPEYPY